jgi:hypothetical protein
MMEFSGVQPPEVIVTYDVEADDCAVTLVWVFCLN